MGYVYDEGLLAPELLDADYSIIHFRVKKL